jgi:phosphotransferase system  glucose/maltose/N-acetylglucosamine-specific IIC component
MIVAIFNISINVCVEIG